MAVTSTYEQCFINKGDFGGFTHLDFKTDTLSNDEIHLIWKVEDIAFDIMAVCLEYTTFPPSKPELNNLFKLSMIDCGSTAITICSFPKTYSTQRVQISKIFNIFTACKANTFPIKRKEDEITYMLHFPNKENVFWPVNFSRYSDKQIEEITARIEAEGKTRILEIDELTDFFPQE